MATQAEIEESIRNNLPIIFGKSDSVDQSEFATKFNSLVDYAAAVSEPVLRPETTRYQSILLYVSLAFVSFSLFQLGKIKLLDNIVSVDRKLMLIYAFFIATVAVIFVVKAYVDYQRATFTRSKNTQAIADVRQVLAVAVVKRRIQNYFWFDIFDAIGRAYKPYSDAVSKALDKTPDFEPRSMNILELHETELRRSPELAAEIDLQEKHFEELKAELARDVSRFEEKAERILGERQPKSQDPYRTLMDDSYEKLTLAFDQGLRCWFDARNKLTDEHLSASLDDMKGNPENKRLEAMLSLLKRIYRIRTLYAVLEIFAPVAFATVAVIYAWPK